MEVNRTIQITQTKKIAIITTETTEKDFASERANIQYVVVILRLDIFERTHLIEPRKARTTKEELD